MVGRHKRSIICDVSLAFTKSFVLFKNASSWHAFFAVNFHQSLNFTKYFKLILCSVLELNIFLRLQQNFLQQWAICSFCKPRFFLTSKKTVHLLSTSRYLVCLKYNCNFVCNLSENYRLQLSAFLISHSQKKTHLLMLLRLILSCCYLKTSFAKLVKVLVLELFYGTRTRVHFTRSFCGTRTRTRTRKLSTRLHHWLGSSSKVQNLVSKIFAKYCKHLVSKVSSLVSGLKTFKSRSRLEFLLKVSVLQRQCLDLVSVSKILAESPALVTMEIRA